MSKGVTEPIEYRCFGILSLVNEVLSVAILDKYLASITTKSKIIMTVLLTLSMDHSCISLVAFIVLSVPDDVGCLARMQVGHFQGLDCCA